MNSSNHIVVEKQNGVLRLGINRPEKKNALTMVMYSILTESLKASKTDDEIKTVLIYGSDDAFTAGNDLVDFDNRSGDVNVKFPAEIFLNTLHEFEKPIVAAVSGFAIGIGTTMLLHCDLVYAAPETRFSLPFVNLGLVPEGGSTILLPLNAGYRQAAELLMLGEQFDTARAVEIGVVTRMIKDGTVYEYAKDLAEKLASKPAEALLSTKRFLKKGLKETITQRIDEECRLFSRMLQTEESIAAREKLKNRKSRS